MRKPHALQLGPVLVDTWFFSKELLLLSTYMKSLRRRRGLLSSYLVEKVKCRLALCRLADASRAVVGACYTPCPKTVEGILVWQRVKPSDLEAIPKTTSCLRAKCMPLP